MENHCLRMKIFDVRYMGIDFQLDIRFDKKCSLIVKIQKIFSFPNLKKLTIVLKNGIVVA